MKSIRKLALFLTIIMVSLSGCSASPGDYSSPPTPTETQETETPKSIIVSIFQFKAEYEEAFEEVAQSFSKDHKDIGLDIETVGGGQDYNAALRAKFNSGEGPTLFNVSGPQDIVDWKSKLADVSDAKIVKSTIEGFLDAVTFEGKVYGLPYYIEGYGLIYNKEIFNKAQIDPATINSFSALEDTAEKLDEQKKELGIDAVFAFPAKETGVTGLQLSNLFISPEFEGDVQKTFQAKTIAFKYSDAFKQMVDLQNKYSVQPAAGLDYSAQVEKLFSEGKVAMIQQGNWVYSDIEAVDKELAQKNIGMLPYPVAGYKEDANPVGVPLYWVVNNSKSQEAQKAAKDFIDWLYLSEEGKKVITDKFKFIPAYNGFAADAITDPLSKDILTQVSGGRTINWVFQGYPANWGMDKLGTDIKRYVEGQLSWEQLIKNAKASWADARK